MALPAIDAWGVENLRFTFFFSEPPSGLLGWWKGVTGADPEQVVSRPQIGEHTESGAFLDGQLELKSAFNRIDWTFSYPFAGLQHSSSSKNFEELCRQFLPAIEQWLNNQKSTITRVAFGAVGLFSVETTEIGNRLFKEYLPFFDFDSDRVKDLFLQVNYPEDSVVLDGVYCNVVSKWGVLTGQFMQMVLGGLPQVITNQVLRTELDLSTPAERIDSISSADAFSLINRFVEITFRVLKEGVSS